MGSFKSFTSSNFKKLSPVEENEDFKGGGGERGGSGDSGEMMPAQKEGEEEFSLFQNPPQFT